MALAWLAGASLARGQGSVYPAGDGTNWVVKGREECGTDPLDLNVQDGLSYTTWSASEFALAAAPVLYGSVPNPMGRSIPENNAGPTGIIVVNPTETPLTVTEVEMLCSAANCYDGVLGYQPATGWTYIGNRVRWTGSLLVPANSAFDFIVRVRPRSTGGPAAVTLSATTSAGLLTNTLHSTDSVNSPSTPHVSLPFMQGSAFVFSGTPGNAGHVQTGSARSFTVRVMETENATSQQIPAGSVLTIDVPAAWSAVSALPQAGFNAPVVTEPTDCAPGSIVVTTSSAISSTYRDFQFSATAPANQGSTGIYRFLARLQNLSVSPVIDTFTEYAQAVEPVPAAGVQDGLLSVGTHVMVPDPMGHNGFAYFGGALANPTESEITITEVLFESSIGGNVFRSLDGRRPATGWSLISGSAFHWTGSLTVPPYSGLDFTARVQPKPGSFTLVSPIRVTIRDSAGNSYVNDTAVTRTGSGSHAANLYYHVLGVPGLHVPHVGTGQTREFQAVIAETDGPDLPAGAELRIVIPAGWSAVTAAVQAGFTPPVVTQPTAASDGEIVSSLASSLSNASRSFLFSATAPVGILDSLYEFPSTLTSGTEQAWCQLVVQVMDSSGGLEVHHLSDIVTDASMNEIDVFFHADSVAEQTYSAEIYNVATGAWEVLAAPTLTLPASSFYGSVLADFSDYFDGLDRLEVRITSGSRSNHRLREDQVVFIVSQFRLIPASAAPPTAPQNAPDVAMLALRFEVDISSVDIYQITLRATGSDPLNDVARVRLYHDLDCNGVLDAGETELDAPQTLAADQTASFGVPAERLLGFSAGAPACALVAYDIAPLATVDNLVGVEIVDALDITHDVGPYPVPCVTGYPVSSSYVLIIEPPGCNPVARVADAAVCGGGTVELDGSDSTTPLCVGLTEYRWTGTNGFDSGWSSDPLASDAPAVTTDYTLEVRCDDPACATASDPLTVMVNANPLVDAGASLAVCGGASLTLGGAPTASGATPPYTYDWSSSPADPSLTCTDCANPDATPAGTTSYSVTVTDANACGAGDSMLVSVDPAPFADAGPDQESCAGESVSLGGTPTGSGGTPPYAYIWSASPPDPSLSCTDCANPMASPTATTVYTARVTDASGCFVEAAAVVTVSVPPDPPEVANSLLAAKGLAELPPAPGDMLLLWSDAGGSAVSYNVRRSDAAGFPDPTDLVASGPAGSVLRLASEVETPESPRFYRVASVNCAGEEGP